MEHIVDYLKKYGNKSFLEEPFSAVDALVLSQFSYLKFENVIPRLTDGEKSVSMTKIKANMIEKSVYADERYAKDNRALFEGMLAGKRFGTMCCNYYTDIINEDVETQFSAMTCFLKDAMPVVVYRGTDENIVGWKEDFNMAFRKPVVGQRLAALYLSQTALRIESNFIICGHSKGGNFAVYSAMNVEDAIQNRIDKIYSFDGPGFRQEILKSDDYNKVEDRVMKFIPHSSLIGMILENHENYRVVESTAIGVLQHIPYTWVLNKCDFKYAQDLNLSTKLRNTTLNEWLLQLNDDQIEVFVETFFSVIDTCDAKTTIEVSLDWKRNMLAILAAMKNVDSETKEMIQKIIHQFFEVMALNLKNRVKVHK